MVLRFLGIQKRCYVGNILAMASFAGARAWKKNPSGFTRVPVPGRKIAGR
jgi:hypothetical protein